jgi:hypothetical protein
VARSRARAAPRNRKSNGEEHIVGGRGMQEGTSPRFGRGGAERRRTAGMALTARPSSLGEVTKCYAVVWVHPPFYRQLTGPQKTGPKCV